MVVALEARTEGWIAGLQLAALSMQGRPAERVTDFVEAFSGSHRHVIDYLADEVLVRQPDEVRDFPRTELDEESQAALHLKAARWLAAHDLLPEAVKHALASDYMNEVAYFIARRDNMW
jgi:ATP/maltotriose-dependent transcriptional regulator MalT